jgi:hypothetical protein
MTSSIGFATMPHAIHPHYTNHISDLVDYAVITDTNSPVMLRSSEFAATNRARIVREITQSISDAKSHIER